MLTRMMRLLSDDGDASIRLDTHYNDAGKFDGVSAVILINGTMHFTHLSMCGAGDTCEEAMASLEKRLVAFLK